MRRISIFGMLKILGVSRSGCHAWLKRMPSNQKKHKEAMQDKIQKIYDESKQNYGAPKISFELRKCGEIISERTVGKYMKKMGIKAQCRMVQRYHLYMDDRRICISDQHYGFIFQENHCLDVIKNTGSIMCN